MGKLLFAVVAAFGSLVLAESLVCNKCIIGVFGICGLVNETCPTNSSVCFTEKINFPSLPSFMSFNIQGCTDNTTECNTSTNGSLISHQSVCCSEDNCNPLSLNGAHTTKMTLTATIGGFILAFVWGRIL